MNKAFKYRFYPTPEQTDLLSKTFGCCRYVWNALLEWRSKEYQLHANKINYSKSCLKLTDIKKEIEWLNDVSSVALQQSLRNQDAAFSNFFKKIAKYPTLKKKNNNQSFRLTNCGFDIKDGKVYIAKNKQPLDIVWSQPLLGEVNSITISKDCANRYFISFGTEVDIEQLPILNKTIGVDLGLKDFAITSDGEKYNPTKSFLRYQKLLKKVQQRLSKKVKGSKNRDKARVKVAKVHNKIADSRKDFLHKLSTKLIRENQTIVIEDLNVKGMIKNHKLAKHIQNASWSEFVRQLKYKAEWYGRTIVQISPWFPSSKLCSDCGFKVAKMPLNIREWTCSNCNEHHDRDVNAAINIRTAGQAELVCGDSSTGADVVQTATVGKNLRSRKAERREALGILAL